MKTDGSKLMKIEASAGRQRAAFRRCRVRERFSTCSRSAAGMLLKKVSGGQRLAVPERPQQSLERDDGQLAASNAKIG